MSLYWRVILKRCLIIGNGPSLADIPDEFLAKYPTFGSNRVYLKFTPTYYAAVNKHVVRQYADQINQMNCVKYIRHDTADLIPGSTPLYSSLVYVFSTEPLTWVCEGWTVTFVLMQLAYWYGFREVGLIGVDHRYDFTGQPNELLTAKGDDPNHFDKSYFSGGAAWNAPDLKRSEEHYRIAHKVFTEDGRKIVNLTPGSALGVFPTRDWTTW